MKLQTMLCSSAALLLIVMLRRGPL